MTGERIKKVQELANAAYNLGGAMFLDQKWTETYLEAKGRTDPEALSLVRARYQLFESAVAAFEVREELKLEVIDGNTLHKIP